MLLGPQVTVITAYHHHRDAAVERVRDDLDRGEVTATTAIILLLVAAAITAGGVIATKITNNANNTPEP